MATRVPVIPHSRLRSICVTRCRVANIPSSKATGIYSGTLQPVQQAQSVASILPNDQLILKSCDKALLTREHIIASMALSTDRTRIT